jgi:hypothetical protein
VVAICRANNGIKKLKLLLRKMRSETEQGQRQGNQA